jgi:hypothetical protein
MCVVNEKMTFTIRPIMQYYSTAFNQGKYKSLGLIMKYKVALVITCTLAFVVVTVALAGYTGPDRETTKQVRDPDKDKWTLIMDNPPLGCYSVCIIYHTCDEHPSVERQEAVCCGVGSGWRADSSSCEMAFRIVTVTLPPAIVSGSFYCGSPGEDGWCRGSPKLDLNASEPLEGEVITLIEGDIEGSPSVLCDPPDNPSISCSWTDGGEGSLGISYWAVSSYGDTSEKASGTWRVDTTPPEVTLDRSGGSIGGGGWYLAGPVSLSVSGADSTSGIESVGLSIDGGGWVGSGQVTGDGIHTVDTQARDLAGNVASGSETVKIDGAEPSIGISESGPVGKNGWFVGKPVRVEASASDPLSGVARVENKLDGGAWSAGSTVNVKAEGVRGVSFRAVDVAGNDTIQSTQVRIDTVGPLTRFTSPADGSEVWISGELTLRGTSTDATSGVSFAELSLNGGVNWRGLEMKGDSWSSTWDTSSVPDGTYLVLARAQDVAGNMEATARITVHVENSQPTPILPSPTAILPSPTSIFVATPTVVASPTPQSTPTSVPPTETKLLPTATNPPQVAIVPVEPTSGPTDTTGETPRTQTMRVSLRIPWLWPALALIALVTAIGSSKLVDPRPRILRQIREDLESIRESGH